MADSALQSLLDLCLVYANHLRTLIERFLTGGSSALKPAAAHFELPPSVVTLLSDLVLIQGPLLDRLSQDFAGLPSSQGPPPAVIQAKRHVNGTPGYLPPPARSFVCDKRGHDCLPPLASG